MIMGERVSLSLNYQILPRNNNGDQLTLLKRQKKRWVLKKHYTPTRSTLVLGLRSHWKKTSQKLARSRYPPSTIHPPSPKRIEVSNMDLGTLSNHSLTLCLGNFGTWFRGHHCGHSLIEISWNISTSESSRKNNQQEWETQSRAFHLSSIENRE